MKTISIPAPSATIGGKVQVLKAVARLRRSHSLHILFEYGFGILCWAGISLCSALLLVFGLFLMNGWCIALGIGMALLSYTLFNNKEYSDLSIKEAIEALVAGKEVSK
ncbi:MAG: hypothetical protein IJ952_09580 [Alistipes sp.]|nr:hypothetical protein [Alistipes sp.]MBR2607145.1 hypothetical protein [Bacteroidaceae bacterium]